MHKIVLLRHGEPTWKRENRDAGRTGMAPTGKGREEAGSAFDIAFPAALKFALRSPWKRAAAGFLPPPAAPAPR